MFSTHISLKKSFIIAISKTLCMLRIFLALCLTASFNIFCYSQDNISVPEFGKVDISELQMKECNFEKGASAMNLLQYETVEFQLSEYSYKIKTETRIRIKIFN